MAHGWNVAGAGIFGTTRLRAEYRSHSESGGVQEFDSGLLLCVLGLQLQDLDLTAVRGDAEALGPDCADFADLALHRAERSRRVFARIENLQLRAAGRGPCAGRRVAAADEIVDVV